VFGVAIQAPLLRRDRGERRIEVGLCRSGQPPHEMRAAAADLASGVFA
jgi:hypothetical protein